MPPGKREISEVPIQIRGQGQYSGRMHCLSTLAMVLTHSLGQTTFRMQSLSQVSVWVALLTGHWQCKGAMSLKPLRMHILKTLSECREESERG